MGGAGAVGAVNKERRYFLIGATAVVGGIGIVGAAVPFVKSWVPSARARALGAPIKVDISMMKPGELCGPIPAWRGQPVFVIYRTEAAIAGLEPQNDGLADPLSEREMQPDYAKNIWRS
jgi:ubiquinol-cytochrome c reductase iron-sulfur subunit